MTNPWPTTTSPTTLVPSLEAAWLDADSSFERFCLTAGIGAIVVEAGAPSFSLQSDDELPDLIIASDLPDDCRKRSQECVGGIKGARAGANKFVQIAQAWALRRHDFALRYR